MSDSVGKISLDLEVTSDLTKQINSISNVIGKKMKETIDSSVKSTFDGMNKGMDKNIKSMNNSLKTGLGAMKKSIKESLSSAFEIVRTIKLPSFKFPRIESINPSVKSDNMPKAQKRGPPVNNEPLKAEIENTSKALDIVNAKIEQQKNKLAQLKQAYSSAFSETRKNKIEEQILKTEFAINSLIAKSDKLGFKLSDLDLKFASVGSEADEATTKVNALSKSTSTFTNKANGSIGIFKKLNSSLKSLGSSTKSTSGNFKGMSSGLALITRQFVTWMLILPLVMKGISAMATFLGSALMTNNQFANSLNQIKSNLYTAFMPIYNAALPAINSLMSALSTATAYIASFISQLFGSTYEASFNSAKNLQYSIGAYEQQEKAAKKAATSLTGAGKAAKKAGESAKEGLMGFDEINKLSNKTSNVPGSGVITPITPMVNMKPIEAKTKAWVDKFKNLLSKIFDPIKQAWDNQGKATMDALKYALGSICGLVKDIGKTFLEVWDNGTGVRVCTDILKLLQTIFNIIGDIAVAFKLAWDKGALGKQVVQTLFDALDSILKLLIDIGNTFRSVWNSGVGVAICTNILEILKNILTIIGQIANSFRNAWNDGVGKQIITDILHLLNGCLRSIKNITASFSKAWATNGDIILKGILNTLDNIIGTISDITNKWATAWENNGAGDALLNSFLNLLGKILTTVGDISQGIRGSIGKATDTVFPTLINFVTTANIGLGNLTVGFKNIWDNGGKVLFDGIVQLIAQIANLIMNLSSGVFSDFSILFRDILAPAIGSVFNAVGFVIQKLSEFIGWINANQPIIDGLRIIVEGLMAAWAVGKVIEFINISGGLIGAIISIGTALTTTKIAQSAYNIAQGIGSTVATAWSGVCAIATGATTAFGAAIGFLTSPIGIAVIAIGSIIAICVALAKNWDYVKAKASVIWGKIKAIFYAFQVWLSSMFKRDWSKSFGAIGEVLNVFFRNAYNIFNSVKRVFKGIIDFIRGVFTGNWAQAWQGVKNIFGGIMGGLGAVIKAPLNSVIGLVNTVIDGINAISFDVPDFVPGIGGSHFGSNISKIPLLAKGGIVNKPTQAVVGEAGTEAVVPLENNTAGLNLLANKLSERIKNISLPTSKTVLKQPELTLLQQNKNNEDNNYLEKLKEAIVEALKTQNIASNTDRNENTQNGDLNLELIISDDKVGDLIIRSFRKLERKTGKKILNI